MKSKKIVLLAAHWSPAIIGAIRLLLTAGYLFLGWASTPMQFLQGLSFISYGVNLFMTYCLFFDSFPFTSIVLPSLLHVGLVYLFSNQVILLPLLPLLLVDVLYLVVKFIKANAFPYEVDGQTSDVFDV